MRLASAALTCSIALLAACTKADETPAADATATTMAPAPAAGVSLADMAGTWNVAATPMSGADTTPTRYTMVTTADSSGWSLTFANRPGSAIPIRVVAVDGDSVMTEAGPFESNRRAGVQVTTRTALRLEGGRVVGTTRASYATTGADTVLMLRTEGTRAQ